MSQDPNATQHTNPVQTQPLSPTYQAPRAARLGEDALSAAARVVQAHHVRIQASMQSQIVQ